MFTGLISFLTGSVFRMVWGEVSSWLTARQEHQQELARLTLQEQSDAAAHARSIESIKLQHDLGVEVIRVQSEADLSKIEDTAWGKLVEGTAKPTGIPFIDIWNGAIRPFLATVATLFVLFEIMRNGWILSDWDRELFGAVLGLYVADRSLSKRGK
ncbi:MAG: hypothetical protein OEV91_09900 [Desulfobulbaceae bacterium]|nr:hypothetical protein [Desulfobulbaceae bacterium]